MITVSALAASRRRRRRRHTHSLPLVFSSPGPSPFRSSHQHGRALSSAASSHPLLWTIRIYFRAAASFGSNPSSHSEPVNDSAASASCPLSCTFLFLTPSIFRAEQGQSEAPYDPPADPPARVPLPPLHQRRHSLTNSLTLQRPAGECSDYLRWSCASSQQRSFRGTKVVMKEALRMFRMSQSGCGLWSYCSVFSPLTIWPRISWK